MNNPYPLINEADINIKLKAKWIAPAETRKENFYFLARKKFDVTCVSEKALLRITADSRYAVYLNGRFIAAGPVRGTHKRYFYDSYDISAGLQSGTNWIAAEIYCPVIATFIAAPYAPGLLAEISGLISTDSSWQVRQDPSHRTEAMLYTKQIGFSEWKNFSLENDGWLTGNDNMENWHMAREIGSADNFGGRVTVPRPILNLTSDIQPAVKIISYGNVPHAGAETGSADYAQLMQGEMHFQSPGVIIENQGAFDQKKCSSVTIFSNPWGEGVYLIIDFGRKIFGNVFIELECATEAIVDIGYDEDLDAGRLMVKRGEYRFTDRYELRRGSQKVAPRLHCRGFRYIQLVFRNFEKWVKIHSIAAESRIYSQKTRASFYCSDAFLNRLWEVSAHTVRMCSSDTFMDCIWREQALWLNDQAVTSLFYLITTGDGRFAAHNLRLGADGASADGLLPAVYPSDRSCRFPSLPALWTFTLADYYLYTADLELVQELMPVAEKMFGLYDVWRNPEGLIPDQPAMWNFIEWGYLTAGVRISGITAVLNMLIAAGYKQAAFLEKALGNTRQAGEYLEKSRAAVLAVNNKFWDQTKGCYRDCTEPTGPLTYSRHPLAIGLYFDLFEEPQRQIAADNLLNDNLIRTELYFQHYVLAGLAKNNRVPEALVEIKNYWGNMINSGSDTIWEYVLGRTAISNLGSLCHAFACAPLYFLQTGVLGIKPLQPGFREFSINPCLAGITQAQGVVPTPYGDISISLVKQNMNHIEIKMKIPQGTCGLTSDERRLNSGQHEFTLPYMGKK